MRNRMTRRGVVAGAALSLMATPGVAQTDWLKKGLDLFGGGVGQGGQSGMGGGLSDIQIGKGLREALKVGTGNVVGRLGVRDGFLLDQVAHIALPKPLKLARDGLRFLGQAGLLDDLEVQMNRAAEQATPLAKNLFWTAIDEMTIGDARGILTGPQDSATRYFQAKMTPPLVREVSPIVSAKLETTGAVRSYNDTLGALRTVPFAPDATVNLTDYVVEKGLDGIFYYVAQEEARIRTDPAARTTDLLRTVFG